MGNTTVSNNVVELKQYKIEKQYREYYMNKVNLSLDIVYDKQVITNIKKKKFLLMA